MLFIIVFLPSRIDIKIGLFPTEFRPTSFLEKCQELHNIWLCAKGTPRPQQLVWGDSWKLQLRKRDLKLLKNKSNSKKKQF